MKGTIRHLLFCCFALFLPALSFAQSPILQYFGNNQYAYTPDALIPYDSSTYLLACSGSYNNTSTMIYIDGGPPGIYSWMHLDGTGDTIRANQVVDAPSTSNQIYLNDGQGLLSFLRTSFSISSCNGVLSWLPQQNQTQVFQMNEMGDLGPMTALNEECEFGMNAAIALPDGQKMLVSFNSSTLASFVPVVFGRITILDQDNSVVSQKDYPDSPFRLSKLAHRDNCSLMLAYAVFGAENEMRMSVVDYNGQILFTHKYPLAYPQRLVQLPNGGFMLLTKSPSNVPNLMRFDQNGVLLWEKQINHPNAVDIALRHDGHIGLLYNQDGHHVGVSTLDTSGIVRANRVYYLPDTMARAVFLTTNAHHSYSLTGTVRSVSNPNSVVSQRLFLLIDTVATILPTTPSPEASVRLNAYEDANQNCIYDTGEALYPNWSFQLSTPLGNVKVGSNKDIPLEMGQYDLEMIQPNGLWGKCTPPAAIEISSDTILYFGVNSFCQTKYHTVDTVVCEELSNQYWVNGIAYALGTTVVNLQTPDGCDSILTTHLQARPQKETNLKITICAGDSVSYQGVTYSASTNVHSHYSIPDYCDSLVRMQIIVKPDLYVYKASICDGEVAQFGNMVYTSPGIYRDTLVSTLGCDSIIEAQITPKFTLTTKYYALCPGQSVTINGIAYNQPVTVYDTIPTNVACDSVIVHNVYWGVQSKYINPIICDGDVFIVGNSVYNYPGEYRDTLQTVNGCDSIVVTKLRFHNTKSFHNFKVCPGQVIQLGSLSYNAPGTYTDTLASYLGCDSIVTTSVHWNNLRHYISVPLCPLETYTHKNVEYYAPAIICDTLTSCYGCDSIVSISLIKGAKYQEQTQYICPGMQVFVGNSVYESIGQYFDTLTTYLGCDSILKTNIYWNNRSTYQSVRLCPGQTYQVGNDVFSQAGNYNIYLKTYLGCDSIISLSITNKFITTRNRYLCPGDTLMLAGQLITAPKTVYDTLTSQLGCDSIIQYYVRWNHKTTYISQRICPGHPFQYGNAIYSLPGTFRDTFTTYLGCDSIISINITWNHKSKILNLKICPGDTVVVGSSQYTLPGFYTDTLATYLGCDSVVSTTVSWRVVSSFVNREICPGTSVWVAGNQYSVPGIYTDTLVSYQGCDSVLYINICYTNQMEFDRHETICHGDSISIGDGLYFSTGNYSDTITTLWGCDSIIHLHLTVLPPLPTTTIPLTLPIGTVFEGDTIVSSTTITRLYNSQLGCDSMVVYVINAVSGISDVGIGQLMQISIQPNPNSGRFTLLLNSKEASTMVIAVHNTLGNKVFESTGHFLQAGQQSVPVHIAQAPPGLYWVTVRTENGNITRQMLVL